MTELGSNPTSNHPPLPPTSEDNQFHRLRLLRSRRVGISTFNRLLHEHGTALAALEALPDVARSAGVKSYQICPEYVIDAELKAARKAKAVLLDIQSANYPPLLRDLKDAPPLLWAIGDSALAMKPCIALVGARNASSLGQRMAGFLARQLGEQGYGVVSGLARGIDAAAHQGALESGTIAVLAGGVDVIYPSENSDLAQSIAQKGLLLSEMPMGVNPIARHFPKRNRIISGLARATVVIEAAAKSGSLITARDALDQGRDVLAVPGHPFDARAAGCNMLIRDGATLVRHADDVLQTFAPLAEAVTAPPSPDSPPPVMPEPEQGRDWSAEVLTKLSTAPIHEDQLIRDLKMTPAQLAPVLLELELSGHILRQTGGGVMRVK